MTKAFSRVIGERKLSDLGNKVARNGKMLAKNMLAYECVSSYAKLLENMLYFPSNVMLPASLSQIQQKTWSWDLFERKIKNENDQSTELNVLEMLERQFEKNLTRMSHFENETLSDDFPAQLDWEDLNDMEISEDIETREMQEVSFSYTLISFVLFVTCITSEVNVVSLLPCEKFAILLIWEIPLEGQPIVKCLDLS